MTTNIYLSQPEIENMLIQFYHATGIRVGIHDPMMNILIEYPVKPTEFAEMGFCDEVRQISTSFGYKCRNCDMKAFEHVRTTKRPYVYKCHMGFTEAVIPILANGDLLCVMMIGQIRNDPQQPEEFRRVMGQIRDIREETCSPETLEIIKQAFDNVCVMDYNKFSAFTYLLEICAQSIYDNRWIRCEEKTIIENFVEYVDSNIYEAITISNAATALKVSRSHLSRIIQKNRNTTFTNYVLEKKVEAAKNLLLTTTMSVKDIAITLKFFEPTYFMRVFKNKTGYTCTAFRKTFTK